MKYIFVGDIHGRIEVVEAALKLHNQNTTVIFIGDIIDSYDRTVAEQLECLYLILSVVKDPNINVICFKGNHELSYLYPEMRASGFNAEIFYEMEQGLGQEIQDNFASWLMLPNDVLVTHAGLSAKHFNKLPSKVDIYSFLESDSIYKIGKSRGGNDDCGGIFWCDYYAEFDPIEGIRQVFGHTGYRFQSEGDFGILSMGDNFNIDCLNYKNDILELDNNEFTIRTLDI